MLRIMAWFELALSILFLTVVVWALPASGLCSGRPFGFDCESWLIFGVNIFAPLGFFALICSIWSLVKKSLVPQYLLVFGCGMLMIYWFSHV